MNIGRRKMNDYDKLTRVVSTKLSIEDDNFLQQLATSANRYGIITKTTKSELVRAIIILSLSDIRQEMDKQSLPSQSQKKQGTSLNSPDT